MSYVERPLVRLVSSDQLSFEVECGACAQSLLLSSVLDFGACASIPLPSVRGVELATIVAYMRHHEHAPAARIARPVAPGSLRLVATAWDAQLVDLDGAAVLRLAMAANYVGLEPLLELCCAKMALTVMDSTIEQLRLGFGVTRNLTAKEQAVALDDSAWQ